MSDALVVLCYDGSPDAKHAIGRAGVLFPDSGAVVLTVWASVPHAVRSMRLGVSDRAMDAAELRQAGAAAADGVAGEGARIAHQAGLRASSLSVEAYGPVWRTIIETADSLEAAIIVMGARGRADVSTAVIGGVAAAVANRARRPTLVIDRRGAAIDLNRAPPGRAARPRASVATS